MSTPGFPPPVPPTARTDGRPQNVESEGGASAAGGSAPAAASGAAAVQGTAELSPAELVTEYLGVADAVARRLWCPGHDRDDLRQVARLGLLHAALRYRVEMGERFVPYAVATISGELKHYLRDQSWTIRPPRGLLDLRLRINSARPALAQSLGHDPSAAELSAVLGVPAERVSEALLADASLTHRVLEQFDSSENEEDSHHHSLVPPFCEPGFDRAEQLLDLTRAFRDLTDTDRRLLHLRFGLEMTQSEIALELGVSQMQVSRALRSLLGRLRRRMQD